MLTSGQVRCARYRFDCRHLAQAAILAIAVEDVSPLNMLRLDCVLCGKIRLSDRRIYFRSASLGGCLYAMLSWKTALVAAMLAPSLGAAPAPVDYARDVKPIFKQHCYRCHGASQQKGGLRADTVASLLAGGDVGPAFKAGDSAASLLVQAILGTHDDISQMPYKKPPLGEAEVAKIRAWIDAGAPAPANEEPEKDIHWAFVPAAAPGRAESRPR